MSSQSNWFIKLFNLRQEEGKPVLYLMVFSFFVGLSMSFYFAASNAIFLRHFEPRMISVSYMASGLVVWLAWFILSRIDRWLKLSWQLIIKFLFVFLSVLVISIGVWRFDSPWIVFVMYTWVRILTYITLITFWGLAGKLFNIRQGKRLFSLLGTGEVISIIIGYFSIPLLLTFLKAADLLFLASVTLLICFFLVLIILRVFKKELSDSNPIPGKFTVKNKDVSYWSLLRKPYFRLISLMALLPIFAYLFVDFLFLSQTKIEFAGSTEAIAGFLGIFLGFVAIIELIFKLVSGRILNRFGLKPSLLILPLVLAFTILLAAFSGTLYGQVGLFFTFIAMARLLERSVRSALYEPSFQLLYQPVPVDQRLIFQNQIEGIPKAFGTVLTGALILLFSWLPSVNLVHFNWFYLLVLIFWAWIAVKMYDSYRSMLKSKLFRLKSNHASKIQPRDEVILKSISNLKGEEFAEKLRMLETSGPLSLEYVVRSLLTVADSENQRVLLEIIRKRQMFSEMAHLRDLSMKTAEVELKKWITHCIEDLEIDNRLSFGELLNLSKSDKKEDRMKAAFLAGGSGRFNTFRLLIQLMQDESLDVRKAAVFSCSKIRRIELFPASLDQLHDPEMSEFAARLIPLIGEPVLAELIRLFEKSNGKISLQLKIVQIIGQIPSSVSLRFLRDRINHSSKDIRIKIIRELSHLKYQCTPSEAIIIKSIAENTVADILKIYATINDLGNEPRLSDLQMSLLTELEEQKEFIFLLLSLLYDPNTIHHVREHIESKDTTAKVYALEISDMIMSQDVKDYFFPIFEDHSIAEKINRFAHRYPQQNLSVTERLIEIINRDYHRVTLYSKACALNLCAENGLADPNELTAVLKANLLHPDHMLKQLAAWSLFRISPEVFKEYTQFLTHRGRIEMQEMFQMVKLRNERAIMLDFEKIAILRELLFFTLVTDNELVDMMQRYPGLQVYPNSANTPIDFKSQKDVLLISDQNWHLTLPADLLYEFINRTSESADYFFSANSSIYKN